MSCCFKVMVVDGGGGVVVGCGRSPSSSSVSEVRTRAVTTGYLLNLDHLLSPTVAKYTNQEDGVEVRRK